jgi:hypothetical protein
MNTTPDIWVGMAKRAYNPPPEAPREEMWATIESRLAEDRVADVIPISDGSATRGRGVRLRWLTRAVAAAAVLLIGVGIGRMTTTFGGTETLSSAKRLQSVSSVGFRAATLQHLARSETLLAFVGSDARAGRVDAEVGGWGKSLLLETRLLLGSPAADDPALREILEDLELILMQVAILAPGEDAPDVRRDEELDLLAEALRDQNVMIRIRSILLNGEIQAGV